MKLWHEITDEIRENSYMLTISSHLIKIFLKKVLTKEYPGGGILGNVKNITKAKAQATALQKLKRRISI